MFAPRFRVPVEVPNSAAAFPRLILPGAEVYLAGVVEYSPTSLAVARIW
jgi:hypothetical protein